ncbi:hypothetical protein K3N28_15045 [Glycomyces sp. TRM65418]|uniref:hypothetical protein n=1 Tax=Glycomyces sp. TRM65418 TaxID=2867006 RepID=UPI001CE600C0|nr:hypothetical protein [Glycomyces sp. TRM65418]MCC3764381.1 hypothetical protein [Glycomyces sp. TRM65418]QZD54058.1 hypothetical protein K3N28_14970 [Glycomyces sp. TRM65418]
MLRKALQGAAVATGAVALAVSVASPAMAQNGYDYSPDDVGGFYILSNICFDVKEIVYLVDVEVLTNDGTNCDFISSETHANGNDVVFNGTDRGWHDRDHKHKHGWDD